MAAPDPEKATPAPEYEKAEPGSLGTHLHGRQLSVTSDDVALVDADQRKLHRNLKGRHMQMIAIGGAIGAGLFVGTGGAFQTGGPGAVLIGFIIIGVFSSLLFSEFFELIEAMAQVNCLIFSISSLSHLNSSSQFLNSLIYQLNSLHSIPPSIPFKNRKNSSKSQPSPKPKPKQQNR
jgi:amino acid permease